MTFDLITPLQHFVNGDLEWRSAFYLWALLIPSLLWVFRKISQKQQQHSYADAHLWPWIAGNREIGQKSALLGSEADAKNDFNKISREGKLFKAVHSHIRKVLLMATKPSRLLTIAWFCLIIALAGPRSHVSSPDIEKREGVDILISMDLSLSMSAKDLYPSRYLFAKSLVESLSNQLETNDRLALQAFAGKAHMVSPLSYDRGLFQHALNLLEPGLLPIKGTWLDLAVIGGLRHLSQTAGQAKVIVIFTNGAPEFWKPVELPDAAKQSPFAKAKRLSETGVKVIFVGVGSPIATSLPDSGHSSGKLHANGLLVQSRLEENMLKKAAQSLEGIYLRAETGQAFMQRLLQEITLPAASRETTQPNQVWSEHALPFMLIGLILLLLSFYLLGLLQLNAFKRVKSAKSNATQSNGWFGLLAIVMLINLTSFSEPTMAAQQSNLKQLEQQAYDAYHAQDFELSKSLYDQITRYQGWFGAGSSAYQTGDIESAVLYFRQAAWSAKTDIERAQSLFNLGNSYYQANLLPQAIESYQQALLYRPVYDKASHNLKLALQRKTLEDQGKSKAKDQEGDGDGNKSRDNEGAFYGGQKPNSNNKEPGFGGDGDGPEGKRSGDQINIPQATDGTNYRLSNGVTNLKLNASGANQQANAILLEQKNRQRAQAFEHELQQLEDDQKTLLKRLFEREAGFHAAQEKAHPIPGVQPW